MRIQKTLEIRRSEPRPRRARAAARRLTATLIAVAFAFAQAPSLATAADLDAGPPKATHRPSRVAAQDTSEQALAHKAMGQVELAALALSTGLPEAASEQIQKAEALVAQLEREAPALNPTRHFKYGKISYSEKDRPADYYVPLFDDVFLVSDYKEALHALEGPDREVTDARVVEVALSARLRDVQKALVSAEASIAARQYAVAAHALGRVFEGAIRDERFDVEPIWTVHDNLALAQNLIREQHYDGARFALQHARDGLEELGQGDSDATSKAGFKRMNDEVAKLETELRSQDPTIAARTESMFSSWRRSVSGWFSTLT